MPQDSGPVQPPKRIVVAMTGASGTPYGRHMLRALGKTGYEVHVTISEGFFEVARAEDEDFGKYLKGEAIDLRGWCGVEGKFHYHHWRQIGASIAYITPDQALLRERAADVVMKEGRKLALLVRESPLSAIALENALKLARLGVHILPTSPAFYTRPKTIEDLVDHTVARTLDLFGIEHQLSKRWGEK